MLNNLMKSIKNIFSSNESKYCPVCKSEVVEFLPLPEQFRGKVIINGKEYLAYKEAEMLNADEYSCPHCGASDRERMYALYLENFYFQENDTRDMTFIHFAPEASLKNFLDSYTFKEYRTADLMMEGVDDQADLTNLTMYNDNSVDFFICSHMLEHIPDDTSAMQELYRILKPKAKAILVVPILLGLDTTYEDDSITSEEDRLLHFGQEDHVRMYNKEGYIKRLANVGFKVQEYGEKEFGSTTLKQTGITSKSILYIVEK